MTTEQFDKAIELKCKLDQLERINREIQDERACRLSYIKKGEDSYGNNTYGICCVSTLKYIGDILDKHDLQIRAEIERRITEIHQEIKSL